MYLVISGGRCAVAAGIGAAPALAGDAETAKVSEYDSPTTGKPASAGSRSLRVHGRANRISSSLLRERDKLDFTTMQLQGHPVCISFPYALPHC
jgi:hypothetical protein